MLQCQIIRGDNIKHIISPSDIIQNTILNPVAGADSVRVRRLLGTGSIPKQSVKDVSFSPGHITNVALLPGTRYITISLMELDATKADFIKKSL